MQTVVKSWFSEKEYGFLDNGSGPDILVRKTDLIKCQYLKIGTTVDFECHANDKGLTAKKVSISRKSTQPSHMESRHKKKSTPYFGVMT